MTTQVVTKGALVGPVARRPARAVFRGPGVQANGLEATAGGLWVCDQHENRVYLVGYDGAVRRSFATPARNASGITESEGRVWVSSNVTPNAVFVHDAATGECVAYLLLGDGVEGGVHGLQWRPFGPAETPPPAPPEPIKRLAAGSGAPGPRMHAGPGASGTLWVARPFSCCIERIDAETGALIHRIPFPVQRAHGMFWDAESEVLAVVEPAARRVYELDTRTGAVLDEWVVEGVEPHGMTRDTAGRIWLCDAMTNEIAVVDG